MKNLTIGEELRRDRDWVIRLKAGITIAIIFAGAVMAIWVMTHTP
jgi:hypothetical protein